eukprot:scaffold129_cov254-Pinguiococcus_pyrenoidosus.AAC.23
MRSPHVVGDLAELLRGLLQSSLLRPIKLRLGSRGDLPLSVQLSAFERFALLASDGGLLLPDLLKADQTRAPQAIALQLLRLIRTGRHEA